MNRTLSKSIPPPRTEQAIDPTPRTGRAAGLEKGAPAGRVTVARAGAGFWVAVAAMLALGATGAAAGAGGSKTRFVVTGTEAPTHGIAGGKGSAQLFLNPTTGAREAALTVLRLDVDAAVPPHAHQASAEILYIQRGAAEMVIDGRAMRAGVGDAVYIPPGVQHSARVVEGPLVAVQVYAGPGPEQRFASGPRVEPGAAAR